MIHKLLAGKGKMKRGLSLLLCLALLGSSVISSNVTAEAESDVTVETEGKAAEETSKEETEGVDSSAEVASDETSETEDTVEESTAEEVSGNSDVMTLSLDGSSDDGISTVDDFPGDSGPSGSNDREESSSLTIKVDDSETLSYRGNGGSNYTISSISITSGSEYIEISGSAGDSSLTVTGEEAGTAVVVVVYKSTSGGNTSTVTVTYTITVKAGDISVYWDTVTTTTNTAGTVTAITAQNSETGVESVSIKGGSATNNGSVTHENGTTTSWSSTTTELTYTTNNVSTTDTETVTVTITPADGYYVTFVAVCCCGSGRPASCTTFGNGNAYTGTYSISDAGTISLDVYLNREHGFHHSSNDDYYFIMIATDKIPSPLYVEYQYGDIVDNIVAYNEANGTSLSSDVFTGSADTWTDTYVGNVYGTTDTGVTNGVMTDDTQYKYTYENGSNSSEAEWAHYANSITEEALAQAAAAGYYFVGWEATYYTTCTETENESGSYNNYTYSFSNQYGTTADYYQPGDAVELTVHVQLVAQWVQVVPEPGTLTITKNVDGLADEEIADLSITFTVTDSNGDEKGTVTLTQDGNWTETISNLNPGTYTVTETSGYDVSGYSCSTTTTVNGNTANGTSTSVTLGYTVTPVYNTSTNTYSYTVETENGEVAFTNTYTVSTTTIYVIKQVTGNMGDKTKEFSITVSGEGITEGNTFSLSDYETSLKTSFGTLSGVSIGTELTVTESNASDYDSVTVEYGYLDTETGEFTPASGTVTDSKLTVDSTNNAIRVTNYKNINPDTGIGLDSAPYILMLAGVAILGGVVLFRRRRKLL